MKFKIITGFILLSSLAAFSQKVTIVSPNQKINVELYNQQNTDKGEWYLKVNYNKDSKKYEAIPQILLGLSRSDQDFSKDLKFLKAGKPSVINDQYSVL